MRLRAPRIAPVDLDTLDDDQREALSPFLTPGRSATRSEGQVLNIFRTLVHAPKALKAFLAWGNYILSKRNALHERDRELVILRTTGAYGMVMASNYNGRPRPAEVLVDGGRYHVIRAREGLEELVRGEVVPF